MLVKNKLDIIFYLNALKLYKREIVVKHSYASNMLLLR